MTAKQNAKPESCDVQVADISVQDRIFTLRGEKVILDSDLAAIYGVETKRLNEQVRRNPDRFPPGFSFQMTREEADLIQVSRSQNATLKQGANIKHLPRVFTEHGALMAANVLNSKRAVEISVFVVLAFTKMRSALSDTRELASKQWCRRPACQVQRGSRDGCTTCCTTLQEGRPEACTTCCTTLQEGLIG